MSETTFQECQGQLIAQLEDVMVKALGPEWYRMADGGGTKRCDSE